MKRLYLPLAVLGLLVPYFFLGYFFVLHGVEVNLILSSLFGSPIATFFVADVVITTVVFWIFLARECHRLGIKNYGGYILASILVGPSFAFPLFMHFRERRRDYLHAKHSRPTD